MPPQAVTVEGGQISNPAVRPTAPLAPVNQGDRTGGWCRRIATRAGLLRVPGVSPDHTRNLVPSDAAGRADEAGPSPGRHTQLSRPSVVPRRQEVGGISTRSGPDGASHVRRSDWQSQRQGLHVSRASNSSETMSRTSGSELKPAPGSTTSSIATIRLLSRRCRRLPRPGRLEPLLRALELALPADAIYADMAGDRVIGNANLPPSDLESELEAIARRLLEALADLPEARPKAPRVASRHRALLVASRTRRPHPNEVVQCCLNSGDSC